MDFKVGQTKRRRVSCSTKSSGPGEQDTVEVVEEWAATAAAAAQRYGELGGPPRQLFNLLLKYATSEDGALHAEKDYRTVAEEFANTRKSMRWRQLIALARVSASEFGTRAPGYQEACELLHVDT